jgi:hypothetical protein
MKTLQFKKGRSRERTQRNTAPQSRDQVGVDHGLHGSHGFFFIREIRVIRGQKTSQNL